jgi:Holliday junction DNA helicase RuvA
MIATLNGRCVVDGSSGSTVLVDCGGVGYRVHITPAAVVSVLRVPYVIVTELVVREDSHTLFGFLNEADRELFKFLIRVKGVGPRLAMLILQVPDVREHLERGNAGDLCRVKGLGPRTAAAVVAAYRKSAKL